GSAPIAIDASNNLWVTRTLNGSGLIEIRSDGYVTFTNLAGMSQQSCVCFDSVGNLYYSGTGANKIYRWLANGGTEVFVGSGNSGAIDGNGVFTSFSQPTALACDSADNIYVWDGGNRIRRINQNRDVVTIAPFGASADGSNPHFASVSSMLVD